jgi:DnaJ like chaperone protein
MSWIGKTLGGTLGLFMGGPIGVIAGVVLGDSLDRSVGYRGGYGYSSSRRSKEATFFVSLFTLLSKTVHYRGTLTAAQSEVVREIMVRDLRLTISQQQSAVEIFRAAEDSSQRFRDFARRLALDFSNNPSVLEFVLDACIRVAAAANDIRPEHREYLREGAEAMNISSARFRELLQQRGYYVYESSYKILGCQPTDSLEEIRKAYHLLIQENHPDKVLANSQGTEGDVKKAEACFREIQAAWEEIKDRSEN